MSIQEEYNTHTGRFSPDKVAFNNFIMSLPDDCESLGGDLRKAFKAGINFILADLEREVEARVKEYEKRTDNPLYDTSISCFMLEEAKDILTLIRSKKGGT
jgi:hypothetical protein